MFLKPVVFDNSCVTVLAIVECLSNCSSLSALLKAPSGVMWFFSTPRKSLTTDFLSLRPTEAYSLVKLLPTRCLFQADLAVLTNFSLEAYGYDGIMSICSPTLTLLRSDYLPWPITPDLGKTDELLVLKRLPTDLLFSRIVFNFFGSRLRLFCHRLCRTASF